MPPSPSPAGLSMATGLVIASASWAYAGFTALCLAMDRHHADLYGRRAVLAPRRRQWLRLAGVAGLLMSLLCCVAWQGWNIGPVMWCGVMSFSALTLVMLWPHAPRLAVRLGMGATAVALLCVATLAVA